MFIAQLVLVLGIGALELLPLFGIPVPHLGGY